MKPVFETEWARKQADGWDASFAAEQHVRFGFDMAVEATGSALAAYNTYLETRLRRTQASLQALLDEVFLEEGKEPASGTAWLSEAGFRRYGKIKVPLLEVEAALSHVAKTTVVY